MGGNPKNSFAERNFILQQGFPAPPADVCPMRYSALIFQPRLVGVVAILATLLRSPWTFFVLAAVLWWSALFPQWNPFDAFYNRAIAEGTDRHPLFRAPMPRRFAQGMAGSISLAISLSLLQGWTLAAVVLENFLLAAVALLAFARFCVGSFLYHLLRGETEFAMDTLPWAGEKPR
jgi:hypothetical protein